MNATINGCGGRVPLEENRGPAQDLIVLLQPADLGRELFGLRQLLTRGALALPAVDLGLDTERRTDSFPTPSQRATASAAAVRVGYSCRWSRTRSAQRSLTFGSIFFGTVRILPTQKDAARNLGRFNACAMRGRNGAHIRAVGARAGE
jgi:hypothetical protein